MSEIAIVGIWHQGSVLSAGFADLGHQVTGITATKGEAEQMNLGVTPVFEPGLAQLIKKNRRLGRLTYTNDSGALHRADFIFISHDTPVDDNDQSDLTGIMKSVHAISRIRRRPAVVCVTAQVPVGACDKVETILRKKLGQKTHVFYVPEFLRLGNALQLFRSPDRIVIGGDRVAAGKVAALYEPLKRPILITDRRSAEMAKHACNAFLAASISFINEISDLCEEVGADANEVVKAMKMDRRIGPWAFLSPGLGFAGGTLGREIRALQKVARRNGKQSKMMDAVWKVNRSRPGIVVDRLRRALGLLRGKRIAVLGLTYKSGTSTMRRAISLEIINRLARAGATIAAYDPLANMDEVKVRRRFHRVNSPDEAFVKADAVLLLTEWDGIEHANWKALKGSTRGTVFLDTRSLLDPDMLTKAGFRYLRVGQGI